VVVERIIMDGTSFAVGLAVGLVLGIALGKNSKTKEKRY